MKPILFHLKWFACCNKAFDPAVPPSSSLADISDLQPTDKHLDVSHFLLVSLRAACTQDIIVDCFIWKLECYQHMVPPRLNIPRCNADSRIVGHQWFSGPGFEVKCSDSTFSNCREAQSGLKTGAHNLGWRPSESAEDHPLGQRYPAATTENEHSHWVRTSASVVLQQVVAQSVSCETCVLGLSHGSSLLQPHDSPQTGYFSLFFHVKLLLHSAIVRCHGCLSHPSWVAECPLSHSHCSASALDVRSTLLQVASA
ncbi:hypothetical protein AAG570_013694 [Ranatra chinensis]|uniref:Uncharacterized protein n=1 Tax=Ranatra chinensis TaxID=642074 RepID=A0ABD0YVF5_9HEMI